MGRDLDLDLDLDLELELELDLGPGPGPGHDLELELGPGQEPELECELELGAGSGALVSLLGPRPRSWPDAHKARANKAAAPFPAPSRPNPYFVLTRTAASI